MARARAPPKGTLAFQQRGYRQLRKITATEIANRNLPAEGFHFL
jgi:hypothetical protein